MKARDHRGRIVTFYSYKGGVGRSMALANVAWVFAEKYGLEVLVVDWDLEAPGLHRFFELADERIERGLLELVYDFRELMSGDLHSLQGEFLKLDPYIQMSPIQPTRGGSIQVLPAGKMDESYGSRVGAFGWSDFYPDTRVYGAD